MNNDTSLEYVIEAYAEKVIHEIAVVEARLLRDPGASAPDPRNARRECIERLVGAVAALRLLGAPDVWDDVECRLIDAAVQLMQDADWVDRVRGDRAR